MVDKKIFASRLRTRREQCGYTSIKAFAAAFDKRFRGGSVDLEGNNPYRGTLGSFKNYENPNKDNFPNVKTAAEICQLLDCDMDYLLGYIDFPKHIHQEMNERFGLSQKATKHLIFWNEPHVRYSDTLNLVLESANFENALCYAKKMMKLKPTLDGLLEARQKWLAETFSGPPDCGKAYNYTGDNGLADLITKYRMEYDSSRLYLNESLTFLIQEMERISAEK